MLNLHRVTHYISTLYFLYPKWFWFFISITKLRIFRLLPYFHQYISGTFYLCWYWIRFIYLVFFVRILIWNFPPSLARYKILLWGFIYTSSPINLIISIHSIKLLTPIRLDWCSSKGRILTLFCNGRFLDCHCCSLSCMFAPNFTELYCSLIQWFGI